MAKTNNMQDYIILRDFQRFLDDMDNMALFYVPIRGNDYQYNVMLHLYFLLFCSARYYFIVDIFALQSRYLNADSNGILEIWLKGR